MPKHNNLKRPELDEGVVQRLQIKLSEVVVVVVKAEPGQALVESLTIKGVEEEANVKCVALHSKLVAIEGEQMRLESTLQVSQGTHPTIGEKRVTELESELRRALKAKRDDISEWCSDAYLDQCLRCGAGKISQ
ncbi:hypothetical protein ACLOJK_006267 [Asimina triloba]